MFGNPVAQKVIRPHGTPSIPGDFHVTATFGQLDADHPTPHGGVDIGDAKCGEPILACADGKVSLAGKLPTALGQANVVRIVHPQYPGYETGYAHLATMNVVVGQQVLEGQKIGTLGSTGANACHLHLGLKHNGVSIDIWPLLDQNQAVEEDGMDPSFAPKPNATVTVNKGARHRLAPSTADPANIAIASDPGGPLGFPLMGTVVGEAVNGNAIWYAYWRPETKKVYYLHTSTCGPETPWEQTGHTDADVAKAAHDAAAVVADAADAASQKFP